MNFENHFVNCARRFELIQPHFDPKTKTKYPN